MDVDLRASLVDADVDRLGGAARYGDGGNDGTGDGVFGMGRRSRRHGEPFALVAVHAVSVRDSGTSNCGIDRNRLHRGLAPIDDIRDHRSHARIRHPDPRRNGRVPSAQRAAAQRHISVLDSFGGAAILGPSLFHPLVSIVGMEGLFFIVSASYILTVLTLLRMDRRIHQVGQNIPQILPNPSNPSSTSSKGGLAVQAKARVRDMLEGIRYVRRETAIAAIIGYGVLIGIVATPFETLLPVVTQEVYGGDTETYGRFLLAVGIGGLVATFAITLIGTRAKPPLYVAIGGVAVGICYVVFGAVDIFTYAVAIAGFVGALGVVKGTMSTTVVQTLVSDQFRGRVMSLMNFTWGAQALGALLMGILAQIWGAPFAFIVAGVAAVLATLTVWQLVLRRL